MARPAQDNSQQLLARVLQQKQAEEHPTTTQAEYFELFCAGQVLKDFDLSHEELEAGIVDGGSDGGVDSVYTFVNGELIHDDFDVAPFKKDIKIELHVFQSKTAANFSEDAINRLTSTCKKLLTLNADYSLLTELNDSVRSEFDNFRRVYQDLAARFPSLTITFHYCTQRGDEDVHPNFLTKCGELERAVHDLFPDADVSIDLLGARELLALARRQPNRTYQLKVRRTLSDTDSYIVIAPLAEYLGFLKDGGKIRHELFESNVRDFQGTTEVNTEIVNTLRNEDKVDFWWMNNGVTILASRATLNVDTVTIENPQIVNGLQTSTQIANHYEPRDGDTRTVMIKIISSEDEETRDKIIKATNRQNPILPASLRATDKVQRDIEEALKGAGLFYDRRKNYYKNLGKPAEKIISIPLLAQAAMSIVLAAPDTARARPSSLMKDEVIYKRFFSEGHPLGFYVNSSLLLSAVDKAMREAGLSARDRSNVRFYALYYLAATLSKKLEPQPADVFAIDMKSADDQTAKGAVEIVFEAFKRLGGTDQVAKGSDFKNQIKQLAGQANRPTQDPGVPADPEAHAV